MKSSELPGIGQLQNTPAILRLVLDGLTEAESLWKPAPNRWSVAEVLEHLAHAEAHAYRYGLDQILESENAEIEGYDIDRFNAEGQYSGRDPEESFAHFEEQREDNIQLLKTLPADLGKRTAIHQRLGVLTLEQFLHEWAFHDLGHIRQITELVRAVRNYPHLGPWQKELSINP